jgi:hypothetical protein
MRKMLIALVVILILDFTANAQCRTRIEFTRDGKRPVAIYDLMADYRGYGKKQLIGTIAHVSYDEADGVEILGFALELRNGIREFVDITHDDCVSSMAGVEKGWVPYIIRKDNKVRVDAEISGSGGFINAKNIIVLNASRQRRRK